MSRWEPDARGRLEQAALALQASAGLSRPRWRRSPSGRGSPSGRSSGTAGQREVLFWGAMFSRNIVEYRGGRRGSPDSAGAGRSPRPWAAPCPGAPRKRPAALGRHCRECGAARARADQARITCLGAGRRAAPARRRRASREPGGRGRDRCLQDRVRTLDHRDQPGRLAAAHPRLARRAESRDRGQMITGGQAPPQ